MGSLLRNHQVLEPQLQLSLCGLSRPVSQAVASNYVPAPFFLLAKSWVTHPRSLLAIAR